MNIILIAVHHDVNKQVCGFRFLDKETKEIRDVAYSTVLNVVESGNAVLEGLKIENGVLRGSNGSFDRYPIFMNNQLVYNEKNVTILATIDDVGYRVSDANGTIAEATSQKLLEKRNIGLGVANGKIVERDGNTFFSAIAGTYDNIPIDKSISFKNAKRAYENDKNKTANQGQQKEQQKEQQEQIKKVIVNKRTDSRFPRVVTSTVNNEKSLMHKIDEKTGMTIEQKLTYTVLAVKEVRPFYYAILQLLKKVEVQNTNEVDTMGVSIKTMYFNPMFIYEMSLAKLLFAVLHEVCHIAMKHRAREGNREHDLWNVATDLFINKQLVEEFCIKSPEKEFYANKKAFSVTPSDMSKYKIAIDSHFLYNENVDINEDTPEKIYLELEKELKKKQQQQGQQSQGQGQQGQGQQGQGQQGQSQQGQQGQQSQGQGQQGQGQQGQGQQNQSQQGQGQEQSQGQQGQSQGQGQDSSAQSASNSIRDGASKAAQNCGNSKQSTQAKSKIEEGLDDVQNGMNENNQSKIDDGMNKVQDGINDMNQAQKNAGQSKTTNGKQASDQMEQGFDDLKNALNNPDNNGNNNEDNGDNNEDNNSSQNNDGNNQNNNGNNQEKTFDSNGDKVTNNSRLKGMKFRGKEVHNDMDDIKDDESTQGRSPEQLNQSSNSVLSQAVTIFKQTHNFGEGVNGFIERFVEDALAPKINWRSLVKRFLVKASQKEYSFSHPDRRFLYKKNPDGSRQVFAGPHFAGNGELDNIKLCIDTSGSISNKDLGIALTQIKDLFKQYKATAELLYWDTEIRAVYSFTNSVDELLNQKPVGGGGTDANCIFDYFDNNDDYKKHRKPKPSLIIIFTDGEIPEVHERYAKKYKNTIWIIQEYNIKEFKQPFGVKASIVNKDM